MVDPVLERLSRIDREASGQIALPEQVTSRETRDRYIVNSLIEEAITSSQLEGAATTREVAKEMLRTGRNPVNRSERMILNNFQAIQYIREIKGESLTPALVIDLHRRITAGTLAPASDYFRKPGDGIGVYDNDTSQLLHRPPPAEEIPARLEALCRFANEGVSKGYLHPVLKAIILHFWLAYDHPFVDGNGRTARALFYWSMISQGYWLFEYVSISSILRKAPARYARAFLYTETDDNDLTYFLLAQLRVVEEAIAALHQYLQRKVQEVKTATALIKHREEFNHRQVALLSHALRHPGTVYTVESHRNSHNVSYQTARTDLLELAKKHLLKKGKRGKAFVFFAEFDLEGRLRRLA
jgi:Fic family protein